MRLSALIPVICCVAALVLTLLAMFAGSSKGFMEDYAIVTLNTSRIGHNFFNTSEPTNTNNTLLNIFNTITNDIENFVEDAVNSIAKEIGLHDFYSSHILTYCEGFYTPEPVPNASLPLSQIHENITYCSRRTATFNFNPTEVLQNELNQAGHSDIQLTDLQWPSIIDKGFKDLRLAARVTFAFYCISIALIFVGLCSALVGLFAEGRISACVNLVVNWSTFAAVLIASSIVTYIATRSTDLINENGKEVGIAASRGGKFLALTWAATGLVFVSTLVWCFDCVAGRKKSPRSRKVYSSEPKRI